MLPSELLTVRRWKNTIRPKYASINRENIGVAQEVIDLYRRSVGRRWWEIREELSDIESSVFDYRFVRGIAALVERRCVFTSSPAVEPTLVRRELFAAAGRRIPATPEERAAIIEEVAKKLGVTVEQVESSLYADLDSEKVLQSAPQMDAVQLLKSYNLSLSQTLLFSCTEMRFTASGNWQNIFRAIKLRGLIYSITKRGNEIEVKLDGPISLFKLNRRYGIALAQVLPEILRCRSWAINAQILHKWSNRLLNFRLESTRHGWLFPEAPEVETYDSTVEDEFAREFNSLGTPWVLKREPEPVVAGNSVIIPDFAIQLGTTKVYLEIIGFWTREYLEKKIEKLREIKDARFILAVDETLACDKLTRLQGFDIVYYKERVPARKVAEILRPLVEREVERQTTDLQLSVTAPVVTVSQLAAERGMMREAVLKAVAGGLATHALVGETLIERGLLEEIRQRLDREVGDREVSLTEALNLLQHYALPDPVSVLTHLGYKIKWCGISMADARVAKAPQPSS